jgi:hypothetical protein
MKQSINPAIFFTPNINKWIFGVTAILLTTALIVFAIFYDIKINAATSSEDRTLVQQTVQIWVGDNGIIYLITWILFLLFLTLCLLSIRDYIPLWLSEFRSLSHFGKDSTASIVYTWNQILKDPQFSSLLALLNKYITK